MNSFRGRSLAQQGESESCGWIISTPNLHRNQGFLGLVGHYQQFIKGFVKMAQPLHNHLSGECVSKKSEWVTFTEEAQGAFLMLKKACLEAPVLAFADFDKPFLLETDASKLGLGAVLSQKQTNGHYHLVAYASKSVTTHESNYHSTKLEFLALKWAITEHFQEAQNLGGETGVLASALISGVNLPFWALILNETPCISDALNSCWYPVERIERSYSKKLIWNS